jgi:hypothetical protein
MVEDKPFPATQEGRPHRSPLTKDLGVMASGGRSDDGSRTGLRGFVFKGKLYAVWSSPYDTPYDILKQLSVPTPDSKDYRFKFLNGEKALALVPITFDRDKVKPQVEIIEFNV